VAGRGGDGTGRERHRRTGEGRKGEKKIQALLDCVARYKSFMYPVYVGMYVCKKKEKERRKRGRGEKKRGKGKGGFTRCFWGAD